MKINWMKVNLFAIPTLFLSLSQTYVGATFLPNSFGALLIGYEEVPAIFASGSGSVQLQINKERTSIFYRLSYSGFSSSVTQAHIHFAARPAMAESSCSCATIQAKPPGVYQLVRTQAPLRVP
jgi:hypothetical protein